ncbi:MAG: MBL fold metallo-hydrolase [Anaerolineaceae bacterium]|nr:MBL fold metallo-hydrolase [Anaerolineaceae bacterium]
MSIQIRNHIIGPLQNNCFLILDENNNEAVMIDPPLQVESIFPKLREQGIKITRILITHAHFDHIGGVQAVLNYFDPPPIIYMHQAALDLWKAKGNADAFNIPIQIPEQPDELLKGEPLLAFGNIQFQTLFTPGHTSGHCTFYNAETQSAFCGDVIFHRSIGRTDLPGGDFNTLLSSIRKKIFTLPPETLLYPGHGQHTSVAEEMKFNPFLI